MVQVHGDFLLVFLFLSMHINPASSVLAATKLNFSVLESLNFEKFKLNSMESSCLYIVGSVLCNAQQKLKFLPFSSQREHFTLICLLLMLNNTVFSNNVTLMFSQIQTATPKKQEHRQFIVGVLTRTIFNLWGISQSVITPAWRRLRYLFSGLVTDFHPTSSVVAMLNGTTQNCRSVDSVFKSPADRAIPNLKKQQHVRFRLLCEAFKPSVWDSKKAVGLFAMTACMYRILRNDETTYILPRNGIHIF